ncbi:MAG: phosphate ABC transporter substrate-binding protein [Planctomycetes bacterium]|nr:phosphate ABC transporter substrate-binding protein [Planctomycetota bacterium]
MKHVCKFICVAALVIGAAGVSAVAGDVKVDPKIESYQKVSGVAGNLNSVGSDTLNNLMTYWAEAFRKIYPNVKIQIEGKGSSTAPPALIEGTSQLGPMSRKMKSKETDAFEKKFGFAPTNFGVAIDCVAVYVNKDNPIKGLNLEQVDAIFSKTRKHGAAANIETWGQAGVDGALADKPISIYGRNSASGTYAFFKEKAMEKGDYKDEVKEQPGSASVVNGVAKDPAGIGYSGIGYKTSEVKVVPLAKEGTDYAEASFENAMNGTYPLGRTLYIYVGKKPNEALPKLVNEFLKFVLSKEGQEIVIKDGYGPLPAKTVEVLLKKLQ